MCACLAGDHNLFAIQVRYWTIVIKFSGHEILIAAFRFGMSYSTSTEVVRALESRCQQALYHITKSCTSNRKPMQAQKSKRVYQRHRVVYP